jgi:hypothetical protein
MIDADKMRRALVDLRVAVDDAGAVTADMLRRPRRRELGPALHRRNYREAQDKILGQIAYLLHMAEEPPAGGQAPPPPQH